MSYGPGAALDISASNGLNSNGDYYSSYRSHYQSPSESHANGFYGSPHATTHHRFDDHEDAPVPQQTTVDAEQHVSDPDKPKLLMWGLTKCAARRLAGARCSTSCLLVGVARHPC